MRHKTIIGSTLTAVMVLLVLAIAAGNASGAGGDVSFNGTDGTARANAASNGQTFDNISIDLKVWNLGNETEITWSGSTSNVLYFANFTDDTYAALGTGDDTQPLTINGSDDDGNRTLNITSGEVISSLVITFTDKGNTLNTTTVGLTHHLGRLNFTATNLYFEESDYYTDVGTNKTMRIYAMGIQGGAHDTTYAGTATVVIGTGNAAGGAKLYNDTQYAKSVRVAITTGSGDVIFNGTSKGVTTVTATSTGDLSAATDATVHVSAGSIDHFDVITDPAPANTRAGEALTSITVEARDAYDNLITDFTGAVTFTSNSTAATTIWTGDPARDQIRLPTNDSFATGDSGTKVFPLFNDTVNETVELTVTHSGGTATGSAVITVSSNVAYYVGILGASGDKTAGIEFNATATVYDWFYNVNYTSGSNVNVSCNAPNDTASVSTTSDVAHSAGWNNTTTTINGPKLVYVNLTNSTLEDIWGEPNFNLTANCTGLLPYLGTSSGNNATVEDIEVIPNNATQLHRWCNLSTFQANGRAREVSNITIFLRDAYNNNCTKTTNATGVQVNVDFTLTGVNATNASFSSVATDTPTGSMVQTLSVPANNSTDMAIATVYLWSNKALSETIDLTITATNEQGLTNATPPNVLCNVTPWKVDHINITFSRDPIVANGTDTAAITAYLEDDQNITVTTACFNVTFDFNMTDLLVAKATGQLNVSNTTTIQASSGVVTGVSVNATKTNAVEGVDDPTQKLNVTANVTDSTYNLAYSAGSNWSLLNVTPGPAAWIDVVGAPTTQTVGGAVIISSTIRDANMNIVLNGTTVSFRTTSGLINMSERTVMGQASPNYTSPYVASTANITATADIGSNWTEVVFTPDVVDPYPTVPSAYNLLYLSGDAPADGTSTVTVTVYLKDDHNNTHTITNTTVYLSTTRGTFAAATGEFVNGVYQTTLTSSTPGDVTVTANIGNWKQDTETATFTEVAFDDNITLNNGWNLISVPKTLSDPTDAYTVFSLGGDDLVQYYDGSTWTTALNQPIEPCKAYWVKNNGTTKTVALSYKTITGAAIPPTIELPAGWCMIGHTSTTPTAVYDALTSINGRYSMVLTSPSPGVWETYIQGSSIQDFTKMQPGQGYWVFMKSSGTYAAIST